MKTNALNGIDLFVNEGEFLMILGQSGSGKTTLLNIIGMLDKPTVGKYIFRDKDMSSLNFNQLAQFRNKEIGFVFQSYNLVTDMKVNENVEIPLGYMGFKRRKRHEKTIDMLKKIGLLEKINSYPAQLSGGQQQRVAIARSLVANPSFILADEPTGNLDSKTASEIMKLLSEINSQGKTIIMITHNPALLSYASRTITLCDGHLV